MEETKKVKELTPKKLEKKISSGAGILNTSISDSPSFPGPQEDYPSPSPAVTSFIQKPEMSLKHLAEDVQAL